LKVQDSLGRPWVVLEGDPAWTLIKRIKGPVVLPVETLVRAVVPHPGRVEEQLKKLELAWQVTGDKDVREAYLRAVALHGSLLALHNA
jgi:hypothetical protein